MCHIHALLLHRLQKIQDQGVIMESSKGRVLIARYSAGWDSGFVWLRSPPPVTKHCATGVIDASIFLPTVGGWALQNCLEGKPFYTVLSHDLSQFGVTPLLCLCPLFLLLLF